jgi:hypothetical protein
VEGSLHNVADLPNDARSAIEGLVGHPLSNNEVLYIATLSAPASPLPAERHAAWDEVEAIISHVQRSAAASGLSPDQIDALLDAECASVRASRRT